MADKEKGLGSNFIQRERKTSTIPPGLKDGPRTRGKGKLSARGKKGRGEILLTEKKGESKQHFPYCRARKEKTTRPATKGRLLCTEKKKGRT